MRQPLHFQLRVVAALALATIAIGTAWWVLRDAIVRQSEINALLTHEVAELNNQIKQVTGLEAEIVGLEARKKAVQGLQVDRNLPTLLLAALATHLPEGMVLSKLNQAEGTLSLSGQAKSNEQVAELLRNLGQSTALFSKPELIEVSSTAFGPLGKDQRRVFNFSVKTRVNDATTSPSQATFTQENSSADSLFPRITASAAQATIQGAKALRNPKGNGL